MSQTEKVKFEELKKEVKALHAQLDFLTGYLAGKDKDFTYRPR